MFCAALPMVMGATAVAQAEQRKKIQAAELRQRQTATETALIPNAQTPSPRDLTLPLSPTPVWLTPRRITQLGALVFVGLLFGSGFYHTHFPG